MLLETTSPSKRVLGKYTRDWKPTLLTGPCNVITHLVGSKETPREINSKFVLLYQCMYSGVDVMFKKRKHFHANDSEV